MNRKLGWLVAIVLLSTAGPGHGSTYVNFETSHVHPIALTPSGNRLLAVNTPDARLEVFTVAADGSLTLASSIPVGLEPVTVVARSESEAWVVNFLSDTVSVVDLDLGLVTWTLRPGKHPVDVAFARGKAFVAVSLEDAVSVYDLADLSKVSTVLAFGSSEPRALAVSGDGTKVYMVVLNSGNRTATVNARLIFGNDMGLDTARLDALGYGEPRCSPTPPPYPALPAGITRNPALTDPADGVPRVGLIVKYDPPTNRWLDDAGQDWQCCLNRKPVDQDLFEIDADTYAIKVRGGEIGTTLFDVSVNPASGKIYVPNTDARNDVRFEHRLGLKGHVVDNRMTIVDSAAPFAATILDLNTHIDRSSDPAANLGERQASISQPGMIAWKADGSAGYLAAIGSGKVFVLDAACTTGSCVFGPDRAAPRAVAVGGGPTGVALREDRQRLYVLDRFTNSIALVDTAALARVGTVSLHDPSGPEVKQGRRFLYDAVLGSGHGDAACSSCHFSADMDGLAWDLGNPEGDLVPYDTPLDNIRFVSKSPGGAQDCPPVDCADHAGFDPQKGPFLTQTLRGLIEPLHWRGDRPTFTDFNPALVELLGAADVGPVNGKPAGLSPADMKQFRDFILGIAFSPNPNRNPDDTLPGEVPLLDTFLRGNPSAGEKLFNSGTGPNGDGPGCLECHQLPLGTAGGKLGGVDPVEPTSPEAAALVRGSETGNAHNDMKIAHLRNLFARGGFIPDDRTSPAVPGDGFGVSHDGSIPNLLFFLSQDRIRLTADYAAQQVRDVAAFLLALPTGTRPCVGRQVTVPAGPAPTAPPAEESLLATLLSIADASDPGRHGELVAWAPLGGRMHAYHLAAGLWATDLAGEPTLTTDALRSAAEGPVTFMCVPAGAGERMGGDRDEDGVLDGDDCAPADAGARARPAPVVKLQLTRAAATARLSWDAQAAATGDGVVYDLLGGDLAGLRAGDPAAAASCVSGSVAAATWDDTRPGPSAGAGWFYQVRARNACGSGGFEPDLGGLDAIPCR